jgi:putative phosphoribosyl transferase
LDGESDVELVRKLRTPGNPEFAIGSVDESGWVYLTDFADKTAADKDYIASEVATQLKSHPTMPRVIYLGTFTNRSCRTYCY